MRRLRQAAGYAGAPLLTALLLCLVFACKGLYPFGRGTVDYYDMAQQIAAFYYHVYDALHGEKSFLFDWYSALGNSMAMSTSGCSNFSLFNLFFLFVKRELLLESLNIFTMLKMSCMSLSMYIFFKKTMDAPRFWGTLFSVGYGLCGFSLSYYITNQWLDIAFYVPLIMYGLWRIAQGKRAWVYTLFLSMALMGSYYLSFMVLIYILLGTGCYVMVIAGRQADRGQIRQRLGRLSLATAAGLLLSAYILVPQLLQTFGSGRFQNGVETESEGLLAVYGQILSQVKGAYTTRWWALLGLALAFACIGAGIVKSRRQFANLRQYRRSTDFRQDAFVMCMVLLMVLELFLESVNLMWHFGSYVHYPIRNGFLIAFTVLSAACFYAKRMEPEPSLKRPGLRAAVLCLLPLAAAAALFIVYSGQSDTTLRTVFRFTAFLSALTLLLYGILLLSGSRRGRAWIVGCLYMAELFVYCFLLLGKPDFVTGYWESPEMEGTYIEKAERMAEAFDLQPSATERVKNPDTTLNANYPFVLRRPALSNWTHIIAPSFWYGAAAWGYTVQYTRLLDAGGTAFSDALLGISQVITCLPADGRLYEKTGQWEEYGLYEARFRLPWGLTVSEDVLSMNVYDSGWIAVQNEMYGLLSDGRQDLLTRIPESMRKEGANTLTYTLKAEGEQALYFSAGGPDEDQAHIEICVNGKKAAVPTIGAPDNTRYPAYFNNRAEYLGTFADETVTVTLSALDEEGAKKLEDSTLLALLDVGKLERLCAAYADTDSRVKASGRRLSITAEGTAERTIALLPVKYDAGFSATVNGKRVEPAAAAGMFTAVPVEAGINEINLTFFPVGMKAGIAVSLVTLLAVLGIAWKQPAVPEILCKALSAVFLLLFVLALLLIYLIPVLSAPVNLLI